MILTTVAKWMRTWRFDVKVAGSSRPTAGELPRLAALRWLWPPS